MRIGNTDVKNWAAIVIDRSKISMRMHDAALRNTIRPGHRDNRRATDRRSRGGRRPRAASAAALAAASADPGSGGSSEGGMSASGVEVLMGRLLNVLLP